MPFVLFETPIGTCGVAWSDAGLTWVQLPEADRAATRARIASKAPGPMARAATTPPWVKDAIARVREHLGGKPQDLARIPLDLSGVSAFDGKVFRALQAVAPGRTTTYGDLARAVGSNGGARAVGRAMATNPFPVVVPCHRVVAAGGNAGGFSAYGGLVTKERILKLEGGTLAVRPSAQPSLFAGPRALPFDAGGAVRHLTDADPVLAKQIAKTGALGLSLKESEGTFAALAESIVYQQLNGRAAATIFGRVRALFPRGRLEPSGVLATSDDALRGAGLSASKLRSLRDLATRSAAGEIPTLPELERMDDEAIVERLTAVRGVGRWTVEMILIFRLGRPDVLPLGDYGIKKGFARLFPRKYARDELPTADVVAKRGERWRPYRSVASWYLWRAAEATEAAKT
ncbi:MAG: methylated-DNA--[protein]-cysteine S-methyltransferase [Labilithrix sp.]|nr:methylated-DNA--[protein]-cysteine S-methyltransferase [Labilithrix sp.]